jgi:hypothetical protein
VHRIELFGGRIRIEYGEGVEISFGGPRKCGKVRYGHRETADKACEAMKRKHGSILEAYRCEDCAGWHIGHSA